MDLDPSSPRHSLKSWLCAVGGGKEDLTRRTVSLSTLPMASGNEAHSPTGFSERVFGA